MRALGLELEGPPEAGRGLAGQALPPEQPAELEMGGRVRRIEPQHAPEVGVRLLVPPQVGEDPAPQHQELGLVG